MKKAINFLGVITILVIILFSMLEVNGGIPYFLIKDQSLQEIKIGTILKIKIKTNPILKNIIVKYNDSVNPHVAAMFEKYNFIPTMPAKPVTEAELIHILKDYTELKEYEKLWEIIQKEKDLKNVTKEYYCIQENKVNALIYKRDFVYSEPNFIDMKGHIYKEDLISSFRRGMLLGSDGDSFNADKIVTREDLLVYLDLLLNESKISPDKKLEEILKKVFNW